MIVMSDTQGEDRHQRLARILGLYTYKPESTEGEGQQQEEGEAEELINLEDLQTPSRAMINDIELIIREIHKIRFPFGTQYIVTCQIKDGNWLSHSFQVYCKDSKDFREKVIKDIELYLQHKLQMGEEVARKV